ncbi:MAG: L-histidine N(alpha)-methyltransferase [Salinisphaeraceae bacterium]|nr:L-histidine N(alpha)-methyltransferase [Salinisphaeraceae bacterium]
MQLLREIPPRLSCAHVPAQRPVPTLEQDVREGLMTAPRQLPPKYFYDELGSRIFEEICRTPEYYPSRAEESLLRDRADRIIEFTRPDLMVELGSGSSRKTRHLLDACQAARRFCSYWPFDVAEPMLLEAGRELTEEYDWLSVNAMVGDYGGGVANLPLPDQGRRLLLFLGGTIGNFPHGEAVRLLSEVRGLLSPGDHLLMGVDRVKSPQVLEAAYDDAAGVTARFNLNLLNVLNRELDGNFDPARFSHRSVFNEAAQQIEMRLRSREAQSVRLEAIQATLVLEQDEEIRTEISRKFTPDSLEQLLLDAGLEPAAHFEASGGQYSLMLARPA